MRALLPPQSWTPDGITPRSHREEIRVTEFPVRVTATGAQPLENALEVLDCDELVIELQVLSLGGSAAPSITVELQTGMQVASTAGWVSAGAFVSVTSAPGAELRAFTGLLRYIRWNVSVLNGSATFFLSGVRRRWSNGERSWRR